MSPLQPLKINLEEFAVTLEGLDAAMTAIVCGLYHALCEVAPPFAFIESKYSVAKTA